MHYDVIYTLYGLIGAVICTGLAFIGLAILIVLAHTYTEVWPTKDNKHD